MGCEMPSSCVRGVVMGPSWGAIVPLSLDEMMMFLYVLCMYVRMYVCACVCVGSRGFNWRWGPARLENLGNLGYLGEAMGCEDSSTFARGTCVVILYST